MHIFYFCESPRTSLGRWFWVHPRSFTNTPQTFQKSLSKHLIVSILLQPATSQLCCTKSKETAAPSKP